jgi:hypothetical protein
VVAFSSLASAEVFSTSFSVPDARLVHRLPIDDSAGVLLGDAETPSDLDGAVGHAVHHAREFIIARIESASSVCCGHTLIILLLRNAFYQHQFLVPFVPLAPLSSLSSISFSALFIFFKKGMDPVCASPGGVQHGDDVFCLLVDHQCQIL